MELAAKEHEAAAKQPHTPHTQHDTPRPTRVIEYQTSASSMASSDVLVALDTVGAWPSSDIFKLD